MSRLADSHDRGAATGAAASVRAFVVDAKGSLGNWFSWRPRRGGTDVAAALCALDADSTDSQWKRLTEQLLHGMYGPVTREIAREFSLLRDDVNDESRTLIALAKEILGEDISVA